MDPLNKLRSFGFSCPVFIKLQNFVSEVSTKNSGDRTKFQKSPDKLIESIKELTRSSSEGVVIELDESSNSIISISPNS